MAKQEAERDATAEKSEKKAERERKHEEKEREKAEAEKAKADEEEKRNQEAEVERREAAEAERKEQEDEKMAQKYSNTPVFVEAWKMLFERGAMVRRGEAQATSLALTHPSSLCKSLAFPLLRTRPTDSFAVACHSLSTSGSSRSTRTRSSSRSGCTTGCRRCRSSRSRWPTA